jgi:hypothetical protein
MQNTLRLLIPIVAAASSERFYPEAVLRNHCYRPQLAQTTVDTWVNPVDLTILFAVSFR